MQPPLRGRPGVPKRGVRDVALRGQRNDLLRDDPRLHVAVDVSDERVRLRFGDVLRGGLHRLPDEQRALWRVQPSVCGGPELHGGRVPVQYGTWRLRHEHGERVRDRHDRQSGSLRDVRQWLFLRQRDGLVCEQRMPDHV